MIHPSEPVLSAAAAAVLLTFAAASAAAMTPGVYSAAVPSRNGELAVEVQVSADRIESVKVVRQQETPGIGSLAVEVEETDCYAIVPKATAELALDPRRTAMLQLSDAAPKLTVRLGWHERTHADPGSQLIRAQLLALIQKRFGRPVGE